MTHEPHEISYTFLALVLCALYLLTLITIGVSRIDFGMLNIWVALGIASIKSTLVLMVFMHLKNEAAMVKLSFIVTIFLVAIFIGFIFWDVSFR